MDESGKTFGRSEEIAAEEELANFLPIDFADIETESDPSARADVGGQVVALGLGGCQVGVFSWKNFAGDSNDSITVVIIEKVGEGFLADEKRCVGAVNFALRIGQSNS